LPHIVFYSLLISSDYLITPRITEVPNKQLQIEWIEDHVLEGSLIGEDSAVDIEMCCGNIFL